MNPPIRNNYHIAGLWRGIEQGVADVLGSDHAPHTLEEKARPYPASPSGMPGVQTLVPVMLTHVANGICHSAPGEGEGDLALPVVHGDLFAADDQVGFAADSLNYDSDTEVVVAEGNVAIKNPEGDTAYGDKIELTDSLRDGVVENLLVVLDNGSRLAAIKGTRFANGNIELENAACGLSTSLSVRWITLRGYPPYALSNTRLQSTGCRRSSPAFP